MASPPEATLIALSNLSGSFVDDAVAQDADAFGLDLDDIAGLEVARRIESCTGAGRCTCDDDVAGHQRGEGRDVVEKEAEAEDHPPGAVILTCLAIDACGQADVRYLGVIGIRHEPRTQAAGRIEILAL